LVADPWVVEVGVNGAPQMLGTKVNRTRGDDMQLE